VTDMKNIYLSDQELWDRNDIKGSAGLDLAHPETSGDFCALNKHDRSDQSC